MLVRDYQGQRHTVTVVPNGFDWQGTTYSSLSAVARAITGTAWSGPRFFALGQGNLELTRLVARFFLEGGPMNSSRRPQEKISPRFLRGVIATRTVSLIEVPSK